MTPLQKLIAELRAGIPSIQIDGYGAQPDCDMAYITMCRAVDMLEAQAAALTDIQGIINKSHVIYRGGKYIMLEPEKFTQWVATLTTGEPTNE